jgi:hypothetical protein
MRKQSCLIGLVLVLWSASAVAQEPTEEDLFPSTYPGVKELINVHKISGNEVPGQVVRGVSPMVRIPKTSTSPATFVPKFLPHLMSTVRPRYVLIFKNENPGADDVRNETRALTDTEGEYDLPADHVLNIAFPWKKMGTWKQTCEQVFDGLAFIYKAARAGDTAYFHCTVGQDRTGALAGIYRYLLQKGQHSAREIMIGEMCRRGFAEGNPLPTKKMAPEQGATDTVAQRIRTTIGPVYSRFVFLIDAELLTVKKLLSGDRGFCALDPMKDSRFWDKDAKKFTKPEYDHRWSGYACPNLLEE